MSDIAGALQN